MSPSLLFGSASRKKNIDKICAEMLALPKSGTISMGHGRVRSDFPEAFARPLRQHLQNCGGE